MASNRPLAVQQGRYWLVTCPEEHWTPAVPDGAVYVKGQVEVGGENGYRHHQFVLYFDRNKRGNTVKALLPAEAHVELCRSSAAEQYVWKEETAVAGTRYELGKKPGRRCREEGDYEQVLACARRGDFDSVPAALYIRHHRALRSIASESLTARDVLRTVKVFWGTSGSGKSHQARVEAAEFAEEGDVYDITYIKDPNNKWWDGYNPDKHKCVIVDEFCGKWAIEHILRWTDKWGCNVEVKGATIPFLAENIWFTSNVHPMDWYPDASEEQKNALKRRIKVVHFDIPFKKD